PNATGIRENTGLPNQTEHVGEGSKVGSSSNMVEPTSGTGESIPSKVSTGVSEEKKIEPIEKYKSNESPETQQWRINNNRVAHGVNSYEYKLPNGMSYGDINRIYNGGDQDSINRLYNELVKLNPELKNINSDIPNYLPTKQNIVGGVASKFKPEKIKNFVETLKRDLRTNPDN